MSLDDEFDALARQAEEELDREGVPEEWGEPVELAEHECFKGRYRGTALDEQFDRPVYLLEGDGGLAQFLRGGRVVLDRKMEQAAPEPGDLIVILRGEDGTGKSGNTFHSYAVQARSWTAPTSAQRVPVASTPSTGDDDIPF